MNLRVSWVTGIPSDPTRTLGKHFYDCIGAVWVNWFAVEAVGLRGQMSPSAENDGGGRLATIHLGLWPFKHAPLLRAAVSWQFSCVF